MQQVVVGARLAAGQTEATLTLSLSAAIPPEGFLYRLERDDDSTSAQTLRRATGTGTEVTLTLATGSADPNATNAKPVNVTVVTPFARISAALVPARPADGTYGGAAVITAFGGSGLPLQLELITEPARVPLAQATAAYLSLPVDEASLFSPLNASTVSVKRVVRPLMYDAFVQRWVAVFDHAYDLTMQPLLRPGTAWWRNSQPGLARRWSFPNIRPAGRGFEGKSTLTLILSSMA